MTLKKTCIFMGFGAAVNHRSIAASYYFSVVCCGRVSVKHRTLRASASRLATGRRWLTRRWRISTWKRRRRRSFAFRISSIWTSSATWRFVWRRYTPVRGRNHVFKVGGESQFLGLGYCTEQNTDDIPSFEHCYVKSWGWSVQLFGGLDPPTPPVVAPLHLFNGYWPTIAKLHYSEGPLF